MDDFGDFCYLDVHKTGSTFVTRVLKEVSKRPLLASVKHGVVETSRSRQWARVLRDKKYWNDAQGGLFREGCFYFNSVRDPFEYYASLYNYGCDGEGELFKRLRKRGVADLYDGASGSFQNWVAFILDEKNAAHVNGSYARTCAAAVGVFTYRFLSLSVAAPSARLRGVGTLSSARDVLDQNGICRATLRIESLNADLLSLLEGELAEHVDVDRAREMLSSDGKVNASLSGVATGDMLRNSSVAALVRSRDALIFEKFYPDM